ncbi:hypothetical protein QVN42_07535 [Yersinia nurmii]|uniref:Uncharacterized protein n=1 Tax=Yersinia nurmii TaxID=685706 RepID=A0AAW7JXQ4_9GAMM|nr:hypothetical protein [Yersinia nurmii]MDN0087246.1 hypothetical protein [Yersinia nurmii]CNE98974.1 Uncharacterised protein [Yersinia nurmii]
MNSIEDDLKVFHRYFLRTQVKNMEIKGWFHRFIYIPVGERVKILDELLRPYSGEKP